MLTPEQEAGVVSLLGAVAAAGVDVANPASLAVLTKTLKVGAITTAISEIDAQVTNKVAEKESTNVAKDAEIATLRSQQDQLRQQLSQLQGA